MKAINLKKIRKAYGASQEAVSRELEIPISTYRAWEQGVNTPRTNDLIMLADFFNSSVDELLGRSSGVVEAQFDNDDSNFIDVPVYGKIAAGAPIEMIEAESSHPVPLAIMSKHKNAFLLIVDGESMNKKIPNGSYALIDPSRKEIIDNKPYALNVNGFDATIKRVHPLNNGFEIIPDSSDPTFEAKIYNYNDPGTETITIIGEVVWHTIPFDWEY